MKFENKKNDAIFVTLASSTYLANEDIPQDPPGTHGQVKSHEARDALGNFGSRLSAHTISKLLGPYYRPKSKIFGTISLANKEVIPGFVRHG